MQHLFLFFFSPRVKPSQMTCSSCSSSRRSPHLYPLKENTCGILMGLRIELYEMSIIARDREIHSSALQVQPTSRWICHLRHLGMFLMVCCQVAWKNPACPVSAVFFCSPFYKWTKERSLFCYKSTRTKIYSICSLNVGSLYN